MHTTLVFCGVHTKKCHFQPQYELGEIRNRARKKWRSC